MRVICSFILLLVLVVVGSCRKDDIRTAKIHVPAMQSMDCAQIIVQALVRVQTIRETDIEVLLESRTLRVRYNSLHRSVKNIEFTVTDAGFEANEVPADPEAKKALPEGCQSSAGSSTETSNAE
jgi:mercuric ion binding protein